MLDEVNPICFGTLIKRYKRFLADVQLDSGEIVTAHCPNSGKLLGVPENARVLLKDHGLSSKRKLRYTWEWFLDQETWVGINTHEANRIVEKLLTDGEIPELSHYKTLKREVPYGEKSRVDFVLLEPSCNEKMFVEVKSVHMKRGSKACFPDCPTERGVKHLNELVKVLDAQTKATVLYLVQRDDCMTFDYAADLDPLYAKTAKYAVQNGVQMLAYAIHLVPYGDLFASIERLPVEGS